MRPQQIPDYVVSRRLLPADLLDHLVDRERAHETYHRHRRLLRILVSC